MQVLYKARHARGDEPPPPGIAFYARGCWDAWQELSTERPYAGMAGVPLPLPASTIRAYAAWNGYSRAATRELIAVLRIVDGEYLNHWHEKNKPPPSAATAKDKGTK